MALIAISSGSSAASTHRRMIRMSVSSIPCAGRCAGLAPGTCAGLASGTCAIGRSVSIRVGEVLVGCRFLVSAEGGGVNRGCGARHGRELLPGNETAPSAERDQLTDAMTIPCDGERLPVFDGVHDLLGPGPEVALGDLWLSAHAGKATVQ